VSGEEAVHCADPNRSTALDQPRMDLVQGDVPLLGNQSFDEIALGFDPRRISVPAARPCNSLAVLKGKASPTDGAGRTDPKMR
jgi:hypothetical protein